MSTNVENSSLGWENILKRAKKYYLQSKSKSKRLDSRANGVTEEAQKVVLQRQKASIELSSPKIGKSLEESVDQKIFNESITQTSVSNKSQDTMIRSKSKDVNEILKPEAAQPEIHSGNASLQGVRNSANLSENYKSEICKNYGLSKSLNSDKLSEIINSSIKAAVQNLSSDTNPTCWKQKQGQENVTPIESTCYNDTCTQRLNSSQNKENVNSGTQYSHQAISSIKPNVSGKICSIYANNGSKRSHNSHQRLSPRKLPTCCVPLSKSGTNSVMCHQSVSKYKQITCPCVKRQPDKSSKSLKSCKPCKPCKPCKHLKSDNRKMTGNVNIYICSEGNEGGNKTKKKTTESTCNSMTVTNASCACSSTDVCTCQSTTSSKTIRNLMEKRKNTDDITLKCACGKLSSDCECLPAVQTKNDETEALCLCDMSSLNPTTSNETCREFVDYNLQTPNSSDSSPRGDYCTRRVRSRSSSRIEPCCTRQNFDTFDGVASLENDSEIYVEKSKITTCNSGRGDAVQKCSCCGTISNYPEGKFIVCGCICDVKNFANPSLRNQREQYVPQNNFNYSRRGDNTCNCYTYENESVYSCGRNSDIDRSVCCQNNNISKPRVQSQNENCCTKSCDIQKSFVCDSKNEQQTKYSNFCIMEEDETCDASTCQSSSVKQQDLKRMNSFQEDSRRICRRDSDVCEDKADVIVEQRVINDGKQDEAENVVNDTLPASQTVTSIKRMSVAEIAKLYSNADKSTSSNLISFTSPVSPSPLVVKEKSVIQPKTSLKMEPRESTLNWPFSKAKTLIGSKICGRSVESKKCKIRPNAVKPQVDLNTMEPTKNGSVLNSKTKNSDYMTEKTVNDGNSASITKSPTRENSPPLVKGSTGGSSLIAIKSSTIADEKSKELLVESNKTKMSSSKLGSVIAERKNSFQSASIEVASSHVNQSTEPSYCGTPDTDICTCQYPQCSCSNKPQKDCWSYTTQDQPQEQSCKCCKQDNRPCCCCDVNNQQKQYHTIPEDVSFRVCTLCCRPEKDCCCNSGGQTPGRSRSRSNSYTKNGDCCGLVCRKSQICLYCEEPIDKCTCRVPMQKCSYCGMPIDVCNCQDVTDDSYDGNICQCDGRIIQNSDGPVDQSICVTAWQPRRNVRKYFSRNQEERDDLDCSCCDSVRPYGSDELPYQRLSVFSDVMNELQQKMSEIPCCNQCGKVPCCCYLQEVKSYASPTNEERVFNAEQRKSRSRSPPCCHCLETSPCKCGGRKTASCQICNRCRTTPCRCRKSRSTQRKPQAKCYYCKSTPCRCETTKTPITASKICRCSVSPSRSQGQAPTLSDEILDRNSLGPRPRSCRCRCGSPSCRSPPRGQERPCS